MTNSVTATLLFDSSDATVIQTIANLFANDINLVTGKTPPISNALQPGVVVIIGSLGRSKIVQKLILAKKLNVAQVRGKFIGHCK